MSSSEHVTVPQVAPQVARAYSMARRWLGSLPGVVLQALAEQVAGEPSRVLVVDRWALGTWGAGFSATATVPAAALRARVYASFFHVLTVEGPTRFEQRLRAACIRAGSRDLRTRDMEPRVPAELVAVLGRIRMMVRDRAPGGLSAPAGVAA
ncbi:MAG: hypothetical protein Q3999_05205 [Buchananella hordeovulneris]|nr:hypothetical protein [Buchananella hordeovulneris]